MLLCFVAVLAFAEAVDQDPSSVVISKNAETSEETDLTNEEHRWKGYRVRNYYGWGHPYYYGYWPHRRWARSADLSADDGDQETAEHYNYRYGGYRYYGYPYHRRAWWGSRRYW